MCSLGEVGRAGSPDLAELAQSRTHETEESIQVSAILFGEATEPIDGLDSAVRAFVGLASRGGDRERFVLGREVVTRM